MQPYESTNVADRQSSTATRPGRIAHTITGPSARATEIVENTEHEHEQALTIFATHGVADAATTLFATSAVGAGVEANPIMASLLHTDPVVAAGVMLGVVAAVAVAYPQIARVEGFHRSYGTLLAAIGLLVAINNLAVVGVAHV